MKTSFFVLCFVLASATSEDASAVYTSVEGLVDTLKGFMVSLRDCGCNMDGSEDKLCDDAGQCNCKCNVQGEKCDSCVDGFFGFPACQGIKAISSLKTTMRLVSWWFSALKEPKIIKYIVAINARISLD